MGRSPEVYRYRRKDYTHMRMRNITIICMSCNEIEAPGTYKACLLQLAKLSAGTHELHAKSSQDDSQLMICLTASERNLEEIKFK